MSTSTLSISRKAQVKVSIFSALVLLIFSLTPLNNAAQAVDPAPTITSLTPNTGAITGGTTVVVTGTNFNSANIATVLFTSPTGSTVVPYVVNSPTQITLTTPAQGTNAALVSLLIVSSANNATLNNAFTYGEVIPQSPPVITKVAPNTS